MVQEVDVDEQVGKRWWHALRRSYGVPDVVADQSAWKYISYEIGGTDENWTQNNDQSDFYGAMAAAHLLQLGEIGELDHVVLDPSTDIKSICKTGIREVSTDVQKQNLVMDLSMKAAEKVCTWVREGGDAEPPRLR